MMKIAVIIAALIGMTLAAAADPAAPSCGKTVAECQKVVDSLTDQVKRLNVAATVLVQQRNAALDMQVQAAINEKAPVSSGK